MAFRPDWTSLLPELINRIAGCFLDTNDVDHYMDVRAVCTNWRSATDDPKNSSDVRFRPRLWIIIDEVHHSDARLLVNTATGRAVRKNLPVLRNYYVIAITHGGFFVLAVADRTPRRAACVLNPFTGHMIRFMAPLPPEMDVGAAVSGSSPTLFFFTLGHPTISMADPHSGSFAALKDNVTCHIIRMAVRGGICTDCEQGSFGPLSLPVAKILDVMKMYNVDPKYDVTKVSFVDLLERDSVCYLVKSGGEVLIILKMQHHIEVLKMDPGKDLIEPVKSIGDEAVFVGHCRCMSVRADKFQSINPNCIYYVKCGAGSSMDICMYDLKDKKEERISAAISYLDYITPDAHPPFTIIQLLASCTINVRKSQLSNKKFQWGFPTVGIQFDDEFDSDFEFDDIDMYD